MRDEQVRRYSRHILLPDFGGLGQTALLVSSARLELREREPDAELIAASFLAAGGVGTVVVRGANEAQVAELAARGADSRILTEPALEPDGRERSPASLGPPLGGSSGPARHSREVVLQPRPVWWPSADGDATALAFWRGGLAAARWMAEIANR